ncbi:MAG: ADP-ribosylglycohydrolase family protein, partial [Thermodesulfobacteriota bacterium]
MTAHAYLRWLQTQGERPSRHVQLDEERTDWLFQRRGLHQRRAPGTTCLSVLRAMKSPGDPARNDSKGCGGVMRVAPVGLFAWRSGQHRAQEDAFHLGAQLAALTHGHPTGSLTGGVLAVLILELTDGADLPEALVAAKACLRARAGHGETLRAL